MGYNILNEPHPERVFDSKSTHINSLHQKYIQEKMNHFYKKVIKNIRSVDKETTIIIDSSAYGDPQTFRFLKPLHDKNIIYSFHMYEPYLYTNQKKNNGQFQYPGKIQEKFWDKKELENYMKHVKIFQKTYNIPFHKILVGEFGCHRMTKGIECYFQDLVDIFKKEKWHFAFYAFREDTWDGMNYELGPKKLPWSYWKALEKGKKPLIVQDKNSLSFNVLKKALELKYRDF